MSEIVESINKIISIIPISNNHIREIYKGFGYIAYNLKDDTFVIPVQRNTMWDIEINYDKKFHRITKDKDNFLWIRYLRIDSQYVCISSTFSNDILRHKENMFNAMLVLYELLVIHGVIMISQKIDFIDCYNLHDTRMFSTSNSKPKV